MTDYFEHMKLEDLVIKHSDSMFADAFDFFKHAEDYYKELEEDVWS